MQDLNYGEMRMNTMEYRAFIPSWTKKQFVDWAANLWPNDRYKFNKMKKKQLQAIWRNK